jgi:hypothetical protein
VHASNGKWPNSILAEQIHLTENADADHYAAKARDKRNYEYDLKAEVTAASGEESTNR